MPSVLITKNIRLGLLLLVALPCLPGFVFILAGVLRDPHGRDRDLSTGGQARYARAREQAGQLYLAGGVVLLVGTVCSGFVVWKIARATPLPNGEDDAGADSPDRSV